MQHRAAGPLSALRNAIMVDMPAGAELARARTALLASPRSDRPTVLHAWLCDAGAELLRTITSSAELDRLARLQAVGEVLAVALCDTPKVKIK